MSSAVKGYMLKLIGKLELEEFVKTFEHVNCKAFVCKP